MIRLHGDYWHHDVLNTEGELETTPKNRFRAAARLCEKAGMIVFGYGGRDRKLMVELFHKNMRKPSFLRNGLYWCVRAGAEIPEMVRTLAALPELRDQRVYVVEIEGFDEAIGMIADKLGVQDWWGEYEAAHEAQAIYKELLDLLFKPVNPNLSADLPRLLLELARRVRTSEAYYVGVSGSITTVMSSSGAFADATEPERLRDLLFRSDSAVQRFSLSDLQGPDLSLRGSPESEYQVIAVKQDGSALGALILPQLPRARDTDHFLMSVAARMISLVHERMCKLRGFGRTQAASGE